MKLYCKNCKTRLRSRVVDPNKSLPKACFVHCPSDFVEKCYSYSSNLGSFCRECFDLKAHDIVENHVKDHHISVNII